VCRNPATGLELGFYAARWRKMAQAMAAAKSAGTSVLVSKCQLATGCTHHRQRARQFPGYLLVPSAHVTPARQLTSGFWRPTAQGQRLVMMVVTGSPNRRSTR
jgi:hypothetical protein